MRTFEVNFVQIITNTFPSLEIKNKTTIQIKDVDWKVFEREKFKIKNKILRLPKRWTAVHYVYCSNMLSLSTSKQKLITIRPPVGKRKYWEVTDCC